MSTRGAAYNTQPLGATAMGSLTRALAGVLEAAEALADEGIDVEVVDLMSIKPLDVMTILDSVRKTSRALVVHEDNQTGGVVAEVAALIAADAFEWLDAPVRRLCVPRRSRARLRGPERRGWGGHARQPHGALLRVVRVGAGPFARAADRRAGRIVVASWGQPVDPRTWYWSPATAGRPTAGSVSLLDARTGDVVRQIATGPIPLAVAVDERRGRAVVTNAGGTAAARDPWAWVPSWLRDCTHGLIPAPSGPRALPGSVSVVDTRR